MDIGENEECPEGDVILLCDVKGCNGRAVWRIGNKRLCPECLKSLKAKELMD